MQHTPESDYLISNLLRPIEDESIIGRPRLLDKISSFEPQPTILLFIAPAGYGKTVLMSQYCSSKTHPVIWYQLDQHDTPSTFLDHLSLAIGQHYPGFGKSIASQLDKIGTFKKQQQLILSLFHELSMTVKNKIIIALDDFHNVTESGLIFFMEEFINRLPIKVEFCLTSRRSLPFSLARLAVEGKVLTIDHRDIRFTSNEISKYLGELPGEKTFQLIEKQSEGWPVALRLIKNSITRSKSWKLVENKQLFDYLADEVLRHQPDKVQHFLLSTSVLDILTPEYCNLLLEEKDSAAMLAYLNQQQLFVSPLEGKESYRYHQLFREFLLNRLGANNKDFFFKAGETSHKLGHIENAVKYFQIAGALERAIQLIIDNGKQQLEKGHWRIVDSWLGGLSSSQLLKESWLVLFKAEVEIYKGNLIEADFLLQNAVSLFEKQGDLQGLSEAVGQQARVMRSRGFYSESIKLLDRALSYSQKEKLHSRSDFSIEKGFTLVLAGKFDESESELIAGLKVAEEEGDNYLVANFSESLSNLYFLKGDYSKSMEMYHRAVNLSTEPIQTSYYMRDSVALIYRDWGELDKALDQALRSIAVKEKLGLVEVLPYAYYQLASIQTDLGDLDKAEENYRRSISLTLESGGEQVFRIMSSAMLAKLLVVQNQFVEAGRLTHEALELSKAQSPYVMAFTKEMVAPVLLQTGRAQEAVEMLYESKEELEKIGAKYPLCIAYGALATIETMKGNDEKAGEYAEKCLNLAARENYLQIFITTFDLLQPTIRHGLEEGIEIQFVQRILVRLGKKTMAMLTSLAVSPEPEVRKRIIIPLTEIGGVEAGKVFQTLVDDPNLDVRKLAEQMAGRLGIARAVEFSKPAVQLMRFDMLGNLKIHINGIESTNANWKTSKSRDLLTYLAHCGEPVTKDLILEHLWPDIEQKKRGQLLHTTLYNLRTFLNQSCKRKDIVLYSGGKYRLREEIFSLDKDRFEGLLRKSKKMGESPESIILCLKEAIELYRGEYLAAMDYSWIILTRENLELKYLQALKQLCQLYMEMREYNQAINYLHLLTRNDPFAEDVFCMLMKSYAEIGNLVMVKDIYQSFKQSLNRELGVEPSIETNDMFSEITT